MLIALLVISVDLTNTCIRTHVCAVLQTITSRILKHRSDPRDIIVRGQNVKRRWTILRVRLRGLV